MYYLCIFNLQIHLFTSILLRIQLITARAIISEDVEEGHIDFDLF